MTAPVLHNVGVEQDGHFSTGREAWRAACECGWKSARFLYRATAVNSAGGHLSRVRDGEWRTGGAA